MGSIAPSGEALELAVGLLRAPALRGALRTRPLSDGVGEVLAIASGSPTAVRRAAERTGYDAAMLLEAARFYVQQVLLTEGTDAYRVLGTDRHADRETLRNHHHLLQRWLHPDRNEGAQWDSALATRVNQAWNQLRTDAARAEYNAAEDSAAQAAADADAEVASQATPAPARSAAAAASSVGAALSTIAGPAASPASRRGPIAVAVLALACLVLAWLAVTRQDPFDHAQAHPKNPTRSQAGAPAAASGISDAINAASPAGAADTASVANTAGTTNTAFAEEAVAATSEDLEHPEIAAAAALAGEEVMAGATDPEAAAVTAATAAPQPAASIDSDTAFADVSTSPSIEAMEATDLLDIQLPVAAVVAPAELAVPLQDSGNAELEDPLRLFEQAEGAVQTVKVWLAASTAPQPAWLNGAANANANAARTRLHASVQGRARARMAVDVPSWTLGDQAASMLGIYRLEDPAGSTLETGVIQIELARRDQRWHVAALTLDPML